MRLGLALLFCALALGCSSTPARTASCQQLDDCCHGRSECDPIVDQNDPGACQTQLVVSRGSGQCMASDAGTGTTLACVATSMGTTTCTEGTGTGLPSMCGSSTTRVASCPTANQVGRCTLSISDAGVMASYTLHFYAPTTLSDAMRVCGSVSGVFTPG